jgi:signal transduction histidine kinase
VTIKHEVNNPLTGVLGLVQLHLAQRDKLDPALAKDLEQIGVLSRRVKEIVARLGAVDSARTKAYLPGGADQARMLDLGTPAGPEVMGTIEEL